MKIKSQTKTMFQISFKNFGQTSKYVTIDFETAEIRDMTSEHSKYIKYHFMFILRLITCECIRKVTGKTRNIKVY